MTRRHISAIAILAVAIAASGAKKTPTAPGTYKEWGPDIDSIEIVKTFKASDYSKIVVQPLDTSSTPKAEEADMVERVAKVAASATEPFLAGVKKGFPDAAIAKSATAPGT